MTASPYTVRRVRKCRFTRCCGLCGSPILVGAREALVEPPDGRGPCHWCHLSCVIVPLMTEPPTPGRAGGQDDQDVPAPGGAHHDRKG